MGKSERPEEHPSNFISFHAPEFNLEVNVRGPKLVALRNYT